MMVPDDGVQEASKAIIPMLGKYYANDNRNVWRGAVGGLGCLPLCGA